MPYSERPKGYHEPLAERQTALWADLYAWTMAQALFTLGKHNTMATFSAFIRHTPFDGEFLVSAGQNITAEWLDKNWMKSPQETFDELKEYKVEDPETGAMVPLFTPEFIDFAQKSKKQATISMMDEGTVLFADEPYATVRAPIWEGLLDEDPFLNPLNSQALFATKGARLKIAANGKPVINMGLRRAHSIGDLESSRGGYIGSVDSTSNMQAWEAYKMPMKGTTAHAWTMFHETELEAFINMFKAMPQNSGALLDTYGTIEGANNAILANEIAKRETGRKKDIIQSGRLDSGRLGKLSNDVRALFDAHQLQKVKNIASSDLDEGPIMDLEKNGSVDVYGVGTRLSTSAQQPALGAVYKLDTVYGEGITAEMIERYQKARDEGDYSPQALGKFYRDVIKLGERPGPNEIEKATVPGEKILLRTLFNDKSGWRYDGDIVFPAWKKLPVRMIENPDGPYEGVLTEPVVSVPRTGLQYAKTFPAGTPVVLPLKTMFDKGVLVGTIGTIYDARKCKEKTLALVHPDHKDLVSPYPYGVGFEKSLYENREALIRKLRGTPQP